MSNNEDSISDYAKVLIIVCSLASGPFVAAIIWKLTNEPFLTIPALISIPFAYPFIGAFVIPVCEELKQWAHFNKAKQWTREDKAIYGAVWPVTLIVCVILYTFLGIIHRNY